jgi:glycine hydroxymethyltransferase
MTTRGCKEEDFRRIAHWIALILKNPEDEAITDQVRKEVAQLTESLPLYE